LRVVGYLTHPQERSPLLARQWHSLKEDSAFV
jgi:hypothetical protein